MTEPTITRTDVSLARAALITSILRDMTPDERNVYAQGKADAEQATVDAIVAWLVDTAPEVAELIQSGEWRKK